MVTGEIVASGKTLCRSSRPDEDTGASEPKSIVAANVYGYGQGYSGGSHF